MAVTMNVVRWGGLRAMAWSIVSCMSAMAVAPTNIGDRIPLAEAAIIVTLSALMVHCFQCHGLLSRWKSGIM